MSPVRTRSRSSAIATASTQTKSLLTKPRASCRSSKLHASKLVSSMKNIVHESDRELRVKRSDPCTVLLRNSKKSPNALGEATNVLPASRLHRRFSECELECRKFSANEGKVDSKSVEKEEMLMEGRRYSLRSQSVFNPCHCRVVVVNDYNKVIKARGISRIDSGSTREEIDKLSGFNLYPAEEGKASKSCNGGASGDTTNALYCNEKVVESAGIVSSGVVRSAEDVTIGGHVLSSDGVEESVFFSDLQKESPWPSTAVEDDSATLSVDGSEHCFTPLIHQSKHLESVTLPPSEVRLKYDGGEASPVRADDDIHESCSTPKAHQFKILQPNSSSVLYGVAKEDNCSCSSMNQTVEDTEHCFTPRAHEFKIPDVYLCPQAPRKRKSSYGCSSAFNRANNSSQRIRPSHTFFLVPDFEAFFGPPCLINHHSQKAHFSPAAIIG